MGRKKKVVIENKIVDQPEVRVEASIEKKVLKEEKVDMLKHIPIKYQKFIMKGN